MPYSLQLASPKSFRLSQRPLEPRGHARRDCDGRTPSPNVMNDYASLWRSRCSFSPGSWELAELVMHGG